MKLETIMKPVKQRLRPTDEIGTASRMFEQEGLAVLPVCNDDGTLAGMATADAVFGLIRDTPEAESVPLQTVLSSPALSCTGADDAEEVAPWAAESGVSHVAVVDWAGRVQGVADLRPFQQAAAQALAGPDEALDAALDEALKETFPASDPVSVSPKKPAGER
jgi:CBS-domain-containing membrane protein